MADDSTTNHPSLPSDYVSILDLRDRWLKKQQQKQPQHQEEEQVRIQTTIRDKGKEKVQEEVTANHPSLPTNYVTIVDLQERWLKRQQQKEEEEENDRIETTRRDKGKEIVQEVTVDCQFDGISVKNNPHFRNPNPNLIPERRFYKNAKEKAQVTVDCQVDGNADKNRLQFRNPSPHLIPERGFCRNTKEKAQVTVDCQVEGNSNENNAHFRNPNPNLVRERGFRRHSNWKNRRPIHRGFHGGEKISSQNQAFKASSSSLKASETSDGVEIEAEIVDDGGQLKDAPLMSKDEKKLKKRNWKKKRRESIKNAKKGGENEEMIKLNVSKIGATGENTRETEGKMKEINASKMKDINVSKIGRIAEKTRGTEAKMKDMNVSKIKGIGEIEAKMKEMTVREECSPDKAKKEVVLAEKSGLMWKKNVGDVRCGDGRAKTRPKMEVYWRGMRVSNEPRWANTGEGNRGVKGGLKWVKKGEGDDNKVFNNGCHH